MEEFEQVQDFYAFLFDSSSIKQNEPAPGQSAILFDHSLWYPISTCYSMAFFIIHLVCTSCCGMF